MTQQNDPRPSPTSIQGRPGEITKGLSGIELTAAALSVIWLVISAAFFLFSGNDGADGLRFLLTLMVIFFPVGMIWVAALGTRSSRIMREESARLQTAMLISPKIRPAAATSNRIRPS